MPFKYRLMLFFSIMSIFAAEKDSLAAPAEQVSYVHRWNVTEIGSDQAVAPPLKLLWDKSPIWLEKMNPGGESESPGRRIADTSEGFVTVMKRTLYLLDKKNGKTLWSLQLEGGEITDWKMNGNMFAYAAIDWKNKTYIRGGIDTHQKKQVWLYRSVQKHLTQHEWVVPVPDLGWIYGLTYNNWNSEAPLDYYEVESGKLLWNTPRGLKPMEDIPYTWFTYDKKLNVLVGGKREGLYLQSYDAGSGKKLDMVHLFGEAKVGNSFSPVALESEGILFTVYSALTDKRGTNGRYWNIASILAYDLNAKKLLWERQVLDGKEPGTLFVKQLASDRDNKKPLVTTIWPNRYFVINSETGALIKKATLTGYDGWTENNAILYSYPYLFTSARRALAKGFAYDLIALNLDTGKIDWSYEIDKEDSKFMTASAEILNFIVIGDKIYLSSADGKIMCFQAHNAKK